MEKISKLEEERHKEFNKWFKKLSLKDKATLKQYFEFLKKSWSS